MGLACLSLCLCCPEAPCTASPQGRVRGLLASACLVKIQAVVVVCPSLPIIIQGPPHHSPSHPASSFPVSAPQSPQTQALPGFLGLLQPRIRPHGNETPLLHGFHSLVASSPLRASSGNQRPTMEGMGGGSSSLVAWGRPPHHAGWQRTVRSLPGGWQRCGRPPLFTRGCRAMAPSEGADPVCSGCCASVPSPHAYTPHQTHTCTPPTCIPYVHTCSYYTSHTLHMPHTQTHIKHTTHTMHTHTCAHTTSMSQTHIDQPPHVNTQHECTTHSTPARSGATDLPFTVSHFSSPSSAGLWASHAQGAARTV